VLNENRGILTDAGAEGAPDFVVEVLSAKTRQLDLVRKGCYFSSAQSGSGGRSVARGSRPSRFWVAVVVAREFTVAEEPTHDCHGNQFLIGLRVLCGFLCKFFRLRV